MEITRPTETVEDYLQLIYTMQREGAPMIAARIKERKGVSAPTAWATLKRMERDGLVEPRPRPPHRAEPARAPSWRSRSSGATCWPSAC